MFRFLANVLVLATAVIAVVHDIDVGKGASLSFAPDTLTAAVGDTLNFHFYSGSGGHSVVSGPFSSPCEPATDAFFSGYIKGDLVGDMTFIVTINSTDPIWFYCSLEAHCMDGMVGVVNPPSGQTVSDYVENASGKQASAPAALQGGVLTTMTSGSGSASTSTSSSTSGSGSVTSMPVSSLSSLSASVPGLSVETTMPTSTGTSVSAATTSKSSSTSSGVAATSTPSGGGKNTDLSVMLGVVMGGLGVAALMA
ncbi:uncharacterized protein LY89DRAFT_210729 [Mollisia scopiformis]|uniref:Extracellular serine-rich protein n=1 Tax=Mollisia scopiformis TaxID=149040 RepID=A0A194WY38_MOLSC|nr:uncharacterized protein LY89DRAFT_210729 [Mollisia scopiformis]KUJ12599.1 hypothetical protein LY89DRAFT_210729 [Mollisia scopiformis]